LLVEHLARIAEPADVDSCLFEILSSPRQTPHGLTGFILLAPACNSREQIKHVEFDPWMTQQMGEVPQSPGVPQPKGLLAAAYGPVLGLFAKYPLLVGGRDAGYRLGGSR
jgi:hypothetical protein